MLFLPLQAKRIPLVVWSSLVITGIAACRQSETYKLEEYECKCAPTTTGRLWQMHCYTMRPSYEQTEPSTISTSTDSPLPVPSILKTSESNETMKSSHEPHIRTKRINSTRLSTGSVAHLNFFKQSPRFRRGIAHREVDYIGKKERSLAFTIEFESDVDKHESLLEITCDQGVMEIQNLLKKLEKFNVFDVGDVKFRNCPLPKNVTYGQILSGSNKPITKFSLLFAVLDSPVLPRKPFEDHAGSVKELKISQTKGKKSEALQDFEDNFFEPFTNLTILQLSRNNIVSTKSFRSFIPNLVGLDLSGNPIENLTAETFPDMTKLQWLQLADCRIESADKDAFASLVELRELDLTRNLLQQLPAELFSKTAKLEELKLSSNPLGSALPEKLFEELRNLKKFTCSSCELRSLPQRLFFNTPQLFAVKLDKNEIESLDGATFSQTPRLRHLLLPFNKLSKVDERLLPPQLETLDLKSNKLTTLPDNFFELASNIVSINLSDNAIEHLQPNTFSTSKLLKTLNLSKNSLTEFSNLLTSHMTAIETIDLSNNLLTSMPLLWPFNLTHLKKFILSGNLVRTVAMYMFYSPSLVIDLRGNPLETIDPTGVVESVNSTETNVSREYLIDGPLKCDCNLFEFFLYFSKHNKAALGKFGQMPRCRGSPERAFSDVDKSVFRCSFNASQGCPESCSCDFSKADNSTRVDCAGKKLATLPPLPRNTTQLNFNDNLLEEIPDFREYPQLREIVLSNNRINSTSGLVSQPSSSWTKVSLANNRINSLGNVAKIGYKLELAGNRFVCTCDTWQELREFFRENLNVTDRTIIECNNWVSSVNQTYLRLYDFVNDNSCDEKIAHQKAVTQFVVTLVCFAALVVVLLTVLYYKNRRRIIVYMFNYHYNIYVFIWPDSEVDSEKPFDAFVSYAELDSEIVNEIVRELERPHPVTGEQLFKLCIHNRDWIPGNSIVYNIVNSVQNSRRTMLVLSENFISSVWLNVEFKAALTQMIDDRSHKLIIMVIGELPSKNSLDKELQELLKNTYLKWGTPGFWDNLRYLLPHKPQKHKAIDKTKSVLNNYGHPMTRILMETRPTSANLSRTAETLENEKNRLKSIAQTNGEPPQQTGKINEAYVAISTEDISVHCDSFKDTKPNVTSGRHRNPADNAVRPPRKRDKRVSEA